MLRRSGDRLTLDVIDSTISWPAQVHDALLIAMSGAVFRPADLPGLDPDEQLVVARRLLREGVVIPADAGPASAATRVTSSAAEPGSTQRDRSQRSSGPSNARCRPGCAATRCSAPLFPLRCCCWWSSRALGPGGPARLPVRPGHRARPDRPAGPPRHPGRRDPPARPIGRHRPPAVGHLGLPPRSRTLGVGAVRR